MVKCDVIAKDIGVKQKSLVCLKSRQKNTKFEISRDIQKRIGTFSKKFFFYCIKCVRIVKNEVIFMKNTILYSKFHHHH